MIFPVFYFGPVSYFAQLMTSGNFQFEACENYVKQTYRNRCYIQGANGKLRLGIPIHHDGSRTLKDIKTSESADWKKEHFKSLISAYKSSPYFEFYEDDLRPIYESEEKFLLDFNLKTIEFIQQKLKLDLEYDLTSEYKVIPSYKDFRNRFEAKRHPEKTDFPKYMQVFDEKHGFMPDLSILDLLFNLGPASAEYLLKIS